MYLPSSPSFRSLHCYPHQILLSHLLSVSHSCSLLCLVWWHDVTLFVYFDCYSTYYIHSVTFTQYIHPPAFVEVPVYVSPQRWSAQWVEPPCGAEPRIELGPESRRTISTELRRTPAPSCYFLTFPLLSCCFFSFPVFPWLFLNFPALSCPFLSFLSFFVRSYHFL